MSQKGRNLGQRGAAFLSYVVLAMMIAVLCLIAVRSVGTATGGTLCEAVGGEGESEYELDSETGECKVVDHGGNGCVPDWMPC